MGLTVANLRGGKLGLTLFLVSDAFTFAALLAAYWYLRTENASWPRPFGLDTVGFGLLMTLCLLAGSFAMLRATRTGGRRWTLLAIAGGVAFLVLHASEWRKLWPVDGMTPFQATFFALTGFHMAHVVAGVVYLGILAARRPGREQVQMGGLYWHFVDAVWLVLFASLYLTSVRLA